MLNSADPLRRKAALIVQRLRHCVNGRYAGHAVPPTKRFPCAGGGIGGQSLTEPLIPIYLCTFRGDKADRPLPSPPPLQMPSDYQEEQGARWLVANCKTRYQASTPVRGSRAHWEAMKAEDDKRLPENLVQCMFFLKLLVGTSHPGAPFQHGFWYDPHAAH